ncbi:hypothetical protein MY11210_007133 [Beauveria gryllotalpidicola]
MPAAPQLPIESLPAWATLQDVKLQQVGMRHVDGKGYGLVAENAMDASENVNDALEIVRISAELVLSREAVEEYAKVDQHFKQLIETLGRKDALEAKIAALESEFNTLRDTSADLPFWNRLLWEADGAMLSDWFLVDAWYRSRCLELPQAGHAMVPALDMVNHSTTDATAYYEEEASGDVSLRIRPGISVAAGDEINISYGDRKSAAEMLFSYGFIDPGSKTRQLTLQLESFPDDPLAMAKQRVFGGAPVVTLRQTEGDDTTSGRMWKSDFAYLMGLNEEDGLDFRILQDDAGDRQLRVFWQEEDVTGRADDFETLLQDHSLHALFQLRAVTVVQNCAANQLEKLAAAPSGEQLEPLVAAGIINQEHVDLVSTLKDIERSVLEAVLENLEEEKSQLVARESVVAYFGSMEDGQNKLAQDDSIAPANEEDDFS